MTKLISLFTALVMILTLSCAAAEEDNSLTVIGGADGPTMIVLGGNMTEPANGSITLSFDANITTGFEWTAFVLGGDSVVIDEEASGYVADANPEELCGAGGVHNFVLNAVKPGESIVCFTYARSWEEEPAQSVVVLVTVTEDMTMYAMDVTETGVYEGTVTAVNGEEHTVTMAAGDWGEVVVTIPADMEMPVMDEHIRVYTDGTMTMSIPAITNAIAWETVPGDLARE